MARNPVEILLRQNIFIVGICSLTGQLSPGEASLQKQGWAVSLYTGGCKYMTFFCQFNVDYRVPSFLESRAWVNVILLLFFVQNIPVVTSEQHPGSCCSVQPSSKILAVCGVKCTVWCTPEVTVRPKTKGKKQYWYWISVFSSSTFTCEHCHWCSGLTLEDMNYTSGIRNLFHHTPQRLQSGIHLHSRHVYTLW